MRPGHTLASRLRDRYLTRDAMPTKTEQPLLGGFAEISYERWRQEVDKGLRGADFDKRLVSRTLEGIAVQPLYTATDALPEAAMPGLPPYRRGNTARPRAAADWDMRVRLDTPDPALLRAELLADLGRGASSLWLCFDGDVRAGRTGAEPPADPARRGAACVSAAQLGELLAEVPLPETGLCLDAGANALPVAACLFAAVAARGIALDRLDGSLDADPLGALAHDGALPCSLDSAKLQLTQLAAFCAERAPSLRAVTVSTLAYHDAGASAVQELGYALATGVLYLRWLTDAGMTVDAAAGQIGFRVAVGGDFFMEIAKLRALRQAWAAVVAQCEGGADAQRAPIHAVSALRTKSARDPWVNMLRETTEAFSAAVGGADAITSHGFDRVLGPSDAFARRIAGNTQVILNEEAHVTRSVDPAGGAYYVEQLTEQLARDGWAVLQAVEQEGDMATALAVGRVHSELAKVAEQRETLLATRRQAITGVSEFPKVDEDKVVRVDPFWDGVTHARSAALEAASQNETLCIGLVHARAQDKPLVELAIELAGRGATLAQLSFAVVGPGEPATSPPLPVRRDASGYEALREAADAAAARGERPRAFLGNLGSIPEHSARAQFATGFFGAGGFELLSNDGFAGPAALVDAFAASGAPLCVLCGSDATYPELVPECARLLAARGCKRIVLAGRPRDAELEQSFREAGVTDFIFVGCDVVATLRTLLSELGAAS